MLPGLYSVVVVAGTVVVLLTVVVVRGCSAATVVVTTPAEVWPGAAAAPFAPGSVVATFDAGGVFRGESEGGAPTVVVVDGAVAGGEVVDGVVTVCEPGSYEPEEPGDGENVRTAVTVRAAETIAT
ncbi:MAG: hypothetical protein RJA47_1043 [Actinomycetota bacterium]